MGVGAEGASFKLPGGWGCILTTSGCGAPALCLGCSKCSIRAVERVCERARLEVIKEVTFLSASFFLRALLSFT